MKTSRLILLPALITMLISCARIASEVAEMATSQSGGRGFWLGISWLTVPFGAWFGYRLSRSGSHARMAKAWLWPVIALLLLVGSVMWQFGPFRDAGQDDETFERLRMAVLILVGIASTLAITMAFVWPRLVFALLCYALTARVFVIALTWLAKFMEWDTHYTKFGPSGIERDMPTTMLSASIAQLGFWVPFTIIAGCVGGAWFGRRNPASSPQD